MKRVFVSSPLDSWGGWGLRQQAKDAIMTLAMEPVILEERWGDPLWPRTSMDISRHVAKAIEKCDIFIMILNSKHFGRFPTQQVPCVQLESDFAASIQKPILVYSTTDLPDSDEFITEEEEEFIGVITNAKAMRRIEDDSELSAALMQDLRAFKKAETLTDSPSSIILPELSPAEIQKLVENAAELENCASRQFEILIARLLEADGWDVELVARNNAPGPDIIAVSRKLLQGTPARMIVECKRHKRGRPVDINVVRKVMYWVNQEYQATFGMIATTSTFTKNAVAERNRFHTWRLDLRDQERMIQWLRRKPIAGWGVD